MTEHSQGSTMVMADRAMATGDIGREGVGVNPLRGRNVQGSCGMGSFPHRLPGRRHVAEPDLRAAFEAAWGVPLHARPRLRIPNMFAAALDGTFRGLFVQGEDIGRSDPDAQRVHAALEAMACVIVQDLFLNETAAFAHVFLPGTSFLEKDGAFANARRRINRVRPTMAPKPGLSEWEAVRRRAREMGHDMGYGHPAEIVAEIARLTPYFAGVGFERPDRGPSLQWPVEDACPDGAPIVHADGFVRGKGRFMPTGFVPATARAARRRPPIPTTGRILSRYAVGARMRRTGNGRRHDEDVLEIHPFDAEGRGLADGGPVSVAVSASVAGCAGATALRACIPDRMPQGVVYSAFHHPLTGANVIATENSDRIATENSDRAADRPECKATAVQASPTDAPSDRQSRRREMEAERFRAAATAAE